MGSGKTTVGKLLSNHLGYDFIDTDHVIEKNLNMTVSEIFKEKGEEFFRSLESNLLFNLSNKQSVISTGGGLPIHGDNWGALVKFGAIVYLKSDADTLLKRICDDDKRPLMNNKDDFLNLFKLREEVYNRADHIVNTEGKNPNKVMNDILKLLFR